MAEISPQEQDIRKWVEATKRNQAVAPFWGSDPNAPAMPTTVQAVGGISDLYDQLKNAATDRANEYTTRSDAARASLVGQLDATDATTRGSMENSKNYLSSLAQQLGMGGITPPGAETNRNQLDQILASNNVNRTNQLASYDLLRGTYGELLKQGASQMDTLGAQAMSNLFGGIFGAGSEMAAASGGGGGGRGGGGRRGGGGGGSSSDPYESWTDTETLDNPYFGANMEQLGRLGWNGKYQDAYIRALDMGAGSPDAAIKDWENISRRLGIAPTQLPKSTYKSQPGRGFSNMTNKLMSQVTQARNAKVGAPYSTTVLPLLRAATGSYGTPASKSTSTNKGKNNW